MPTFGALLLRGLLAGLVAGLLAGTVAFVAGEPRIDAAIALEEQAAHAADTGADTGAHGGAEPAGHEEELVSRGGQRVGLFLALGLFGLAMGGMFATAYALLRRRLRARSHSTAALGLAAAAFLGAVLVPFGKYPANPPAVGDPETITQRTLTYLALVVLGLLAVWAGVAAFRAVREGAPEWFRLGAAAGAFLLTVGVAYAVLPALDEVPDGFPASLLWQFRLASLGTQAVLWTGIGLGFAALVDRPVPGPARSPVAEPAAAQ